MDMLAEAFNEKTLKGKDDVRKYARAVGKLRKAAESVKDILSANQEYQVGIEALHDDRDLRMVIKRADFEARAEKEGLWARLVPPLEAALAQANLTKEEIHRVEVIGGATRIPRVKQAAKTFFGRSQLDGAINGDEAGALGATLYAAKLSTSFRLRDFGIVDGFPFPTSIRISSADAAEPATEPAADEPAADEAKDEDKEAEAGAPSKKGKDKLLFKVRPPRRPLPPPATAPPVPSPLSVPCCPLSRR